MTPEPVAGTAPLRRSIARELWSSQRWRWRLLRLALTLGLGVVLLVGVLLVFFEDSFIYVPSRYPEGDWDIALPAPSSVGEGTIGTAIVDCRLTASDGVRLHGWFCTPQRRVGAAWQPVEYRAVWLYCHGNAGNISDRRDFLDALMTLPVAVLIIDYRGYGKSEGTPSEAGLYRDVHAAWDFLTGERHIDPGRIIIFGKSLGGGPAVELATAVQPAGLIVQSSFTSIPAMAGQVLPIVPGFLVRTQMDSLKRIVGIRCPKLFIHSRTDEVIPFAHGEKLFAAAPEPKRFYVIADAGHNQTWQVGGEAYLEEVRKFTNECVGAPGAGGR